MACVQEHIPFLPSSNQRDQIYLCLPFVRGRSGIIPCYPVVSRNMPLPRLAATLSAFGRVRRRNLTAAHLIWGKQRRGNWGCSKKLVEACPVTFHTCVSFPMQFQPLLIVKYTTSELSRTLL